MKSKILNLNINLSELISKSANQQISKIELPKVILLLLLFVMMQTKSYGNTCNTAIVVNTIDYNYNFTDYTMPDSNLFLKFTADSSELYFIIARPANTTSVMAELTTVQLYAGTCGSLNLIKTSTFFMDPDSISFVFTMDNLTVGTDYYLKVKRLYQPTICNTCNITAYIAGTIIKANNGVIDDHPEIDCQLNCNGNFNLTQAGITCILGNALWFNGFLLPGITFPFNNGCVPCWGRSHGSPQINLSPNFTPVTGPGNFAAMACTFSNAIQQPISEGIVTNLNTAMIQNNLYYGSFQMRTNNAAATIDAVIPLFCNSATSNLPAPSIATGAEVAPTGFPNQGLNFNIIGFTNANWQNFDFCLQAQQDWNQFFIYPFENFPATPNFLYFDNLIINSAIELGPDITINGCKTTLENLCDAPNSTFQWSSNNNVTFSTPTASSTDVIFPTNTTNAPIQYACTLTVTMTVNGNQCSGFDIITVTVNPYNLGVTLTQNIDNCVTINNGTISAIVNGGTSPFNYLWNTSSVTSSITNLTAAPYTVTVTDANSCTVSKSLTLYDCCSTPSATGFVLTGTYNVSTMIGNPNYGSFLSVAGTSAFFDNGFNGQPYGANLELVLNGTLIIDMNTVFRNLNMVLGPYASIVVNDGYSLNFEGPNGSYLHGCGGYMWDGITINNSSNGNIVSFYNKTNISWIEDAEHAIYVNGQAAIKAINLVLNKNHIGILFENSAGFSNTSQIIGNNFQSNNLVNLVAQTCIPPYFGQRAEKGIHVGNLSNINIGGYYPGAFPVDENIFRNLDYGIYVDASTVNIRNNQFIDLIELLPGTNRGTAIFATGYKKIIPGNGPSTITVGGTGTDEYNQFWNCHNGIVMRNRVENDIIANSFYNTRIGIDARITTFVTHGLYQSNTFVNALNYPLYNKSIAINIVNPNIQDAHTRIEGNTITDYRQAIHATNINDLIIDGSSTTHNTVRWNIANANITQLHYGAWLEHCPNAQVNYMDIAKTTGTPNGLLDVQGITIDNSDACLIAENKMTTIGSGIRVKDFCNGSELHCNIMDGCSRGVNLQNADLPAQGNAASLIAWGNQWQNMTLPNIRVNGTTSGSIIDWYFQGAQGFGNTYYPGNVPFVVNAVTATSTDPCITQIINHDSDYVADDVLDVLDGSGNGGSAPGSEADYYSSDFAFRQLRADSSMFDSTSIYFNDRVQFLNEMSSTALGKFYDVVTFINKDMNADAMTLLQTVVPDNAIEENLYQTLYIYLTTYALNIESNEIEWNTLLSIAQQTVLSGGPGVYNARAMTGWEQDDLPGVLRQGNFAEQAFLISENSHPEFYPNPTNEVIVLPYTIAEYEEIRIDVHDVFGTLLLSKYFTIGKQIKLELNNKLNGIYYARAYINNTTWFQSKITLIK